jgi:hypothetical protein
VAHAPAGTAGQDNDGPLGQAPSKSPRPTGGCRVGDQARPTDHYPDNPQASAGKLGVRPGSDTHPNPGPNHPAGGGYQAREILVAGSGRYLPVGHLRGIAPTRRYGRPSRGLLARRRR